MLYSRHLADCRQLSHTPAECLLCPMHLVIELCDKSFLYASAGQLVVAAREIDFSRYAVCEYKQFEAQTSDMTKYMPHTDLWTITSGDSLMVFINTTNTMPP